MMSTPISQAAERLMQAENTKIYCKPVRDLIDAIDLESAYKIQQFIHQEKLKNGWIPVGKKIGLTAAAVQKQLGVDQPDYGILYRRMLAPNAGNLSVKQCMQPKVEAEMAFVLKKDLPVHEIEAVDFVQFVDYVQLAIEIAGSRIQNWDIRIADTIADNASASHFVLGKEKIKPSMLNFKQEAMQLYCNNVLVSEGTAQACMGSPLIAASWLANSMLKLGKPLKAGETILSGALGPMVNAHQGDHFVAKIEGLGQAEVHFSE